VTLTGGPLQTGRPLADSDSFSLDSLIAAAERFITLFHSENPAGPPAQRLRQVVREIKSTGTYWHTPEELEFGARVAWRNSSRGIGRLYWNSLRVRDRREITGAADIAAESITHLREATNGGRIRPVMTVFAPDAPGRPGPRILSQQLLQYAGYQTPWGSISGDPASADVTRLALELGWPRPQPPGRFDILPLIVQGAGAAPTLHELPADAVLEVPISHPEFGWFAGLGLRWYAVPVISNMYLDIGGVCYTAVPFNGWYLCTEVGARELGDACRYDQLPVIAEHMRLSTASDRTLWKDRAMNELNLAVLHSFTAAGVTITDQHTESTRLVQDIKPEERHERVCPPAASSASPVFHRHYQNFDETPNLYRHLAPLPQPEAPAQPQAGVPQVPPDSLAGLGQADLPGMNRGGRHHGRRRPLSRTLGRARAGRHA